MDKIASNLQARIKYLQLVASGERTIEQYEEFFKPKVIPINYKKSFTYSCNLR